ncbi:MAG: serine hydrolase [Bellilinea sp.]
MRRGNTAIFRWLSIGIVFLGVLITVFELISYSRLRSAFPAGTVIAGVPVAGLTRQETAERLIQVYSAPVEMRYGDAVIQIKPSVAGFKMDIESMLAAADQQRVSLPFWNGFWGYLWNQQSEPIEIPLRAETSDSRLRTYLRDDVASRYDKEPSAAQPVPGSSSFQPGQSGTVMDIDRAVILVNDALRNPTNRVVNLTYSRVNPTRPSFPNLQVMMQQILSVNKFQGLAEIYLQDITTGQEINFAYNNGEIIAPGIAFTAASTMKIPIMISSYRRLDEPAPAEISSLMESMIELSENDPADRLMEQVIDNRLGPLGVTEDLQTMGYQNTFMAGFFYPGAPLLRDYSTPANQRKDVSAEPDRYNQTTPVEAGQLLSDVYQCATYGGGTFTAVFPGEISQSECRQMISYLSRNRIAVLIEAGVPEGVQVAHKHGWLTDSADGLIHTISDAGIVYTPGGNFILVIYLYDQNQLLFDPANKLVAQITQSIYNYYNMAGQ